MPTIVFFIVFACLLGSALAGLSSARVLPEHHLSAASKDVIYAFMNVIALLAKSPQVTPLEPPEVFLTRFGLLRFQQ